MKYYYLFLLLLLSTSCLKKQNSPSKKDKQKAEIILQTINPQRELNAAFLIIDGVYNSELMAPYDIFQHTIFHTNPGIRVFTVAPKDTVVTSFEGIRMLPDYHFNSDGLPDIDILIVPSAQHNMDTDLENEELIQFVSDVGSKAMFSISLCDGAFILAKAGLVDGKISTTFPSDIPRYRATFPGLEVIESVSFVHDGDVLTSAGGAKSYDVALYLTELLYGKKVAVGVGKGLVIDWKLSDYSFKIAE